MESQKVKKLLFFVAISTGLFANTYYSKLEPVETYTIKSDISGKVLFSDIAKEGTYVKDAKLVQIDDALNRKNLKSVNEKIAYLQTILTISLANLKNLEEVEAIKEDRYKKYLSLTTKSAFDKENELITFITSQNQTLSLKQSIENTKVQLSDLAYQKATLEDSIEKKSITIKDRYINKVNIKVEDVVAIGTPIAELYDISKGKLTIFLTKEDAQMIEKLDFYIDGEKVIDPNYKLWSVADVQNISAYKCEITVDAPKYFSKLIKVELQPK
jgi:hypothetical protein